MIKMLLTMDLFAERMTFTRFLNAGIGNDKVLFAEVAKLIEIWVEFAGERIQLG